MFKNIGKALILSSFAFLASGITSHHQAHADTKGIIELFTSQGCSSCPPADELAAYYAENPDYVVLTLPITYWDYLGWKDTFAQKKFTNRQYAYAKLRGDRSVYTPQVVINGYADAVGSNQGQINALLKTQKLSVNVDIEENGDNLEIKVNKGNGNEKARVWLALYQAKGTVAIARGENRNRTITYTNIVKEMRPLSNWQGEELALNFSKNEISGQGYDGAAFLVQTETQNLPSKILGAASWDAK